MSNAQALKIPSDQLHDAEIISISVIRGEETVRFAFSLQDGGCASLVCSKVSCFRATDFLLQNVVSRILISNEHKFSDEDLEQWVTWANTTSRDASFIKASAISQYVDDIKAGVRNLLVLEPSWGSECAIICGAAVFKRSESLSVCI